MPYRGSGRGGAPVVLHGRFIEGVAERIDDVASHEAQQRKQAVAGYEIVYAAPGQCAARMTRLIEGRRRPATLARVRLGRTSAFLARASAATTIRARDARLGRAASS
jgi:hypothetical protein